MINARCFMRSSYKSFLRTSLKFSPCSLAQSEAYLSSSARNNNAFLNEKEKLIIFDTTLRDGEQSPGATLTFNEKINIARSLSKLGVDVCEAGFPIASPGDFESVKAIAKEVGPMLEHRLTQEPMTICGLARALEKDIERCYEAVRYAPKHRLHTFLATSDIHLKYKLKISKRQCIEQAAKAVKFALSLCPDVEFSTEDAGRTDPNFLLDVVTAVIEAGVKTVNMPDTVGYASPEEYGRMFAFVRDRIPQSSNVVFSTHCHNDLGLATANSLSAVLNGGARQVEVTINGIGERAGNTALEEVVMALRTRPQHYPVYTTVNSEEITKTSRMVSRYTGISVQPNKAIVGDNAFAHEAGIHQDGVLKHQATYEIMLPASVGLKQNKMILGKHSGKHAYKKRLEALGYSSLSDEQLDAFVEKFKILADEKKLVTDSDIIAIVENNIYEPSATWVLSQIHVTAGNQLKATATVTMKNTKHNEEKNYAAIGSGPVDAAFRAIRNALNIGIHLDEYNVKSITGGTSALGEVSVRIKEKDGIDDNHENLVEIDDDDEDNTTNPQTGMCRKRSYIGYGTDTDILVASANAYVNAINRLLQAKEKESKITRWVNEEKTKEGTA